ncbi:MAG TPA: nucleotidyl transferase AbiEii/AbiGii toxin family protein, partial [Thermomicrobiales bacterium]|nr:nucleotidyl transferase AbiEii/AbiGii toxin family protein [Thermomicrobiales bacterium]
MKYATAAAFRSALEARLNRQSRESGISLVRLRKLVVFDRLLARLIVLAPDRWVLKGGVALQYRLESEARTTMDLDVSWSGRRDDISGQMSMLPSVLLDDFFIFSIEMVDGQGDNHRSFRFRVSAELAGRHFDSVTLDIGLDYPRATEPEVLMSPDLLGFSEIEPHGVPTISIVRHLAEKVHAYSRLYEGGRSSTRVKDFVDMLLIASAFEIHAGEVRETLSIVFKERGTHNVPGSLAPPPAGWR